MPTVCTNNTITRTIPYKQGGPAHKHLPNGYFIICPYCFNHIEHEENEISRHITANHNHEKIVENGHLRVNYGECRLIPRWAAIDLFGESRVTTLEDSPRYTGEKTITAAALTNDEELVRVYHEKGYQPPPILHGIRKDPLPKFAQLEKKSEWEDHHTQIARMWLDKGGYDYDVVGDDDDDEE
jgi:hypothetical protein